MSWDEHTFTIVMQVSKDLNDTGKTPEQFHEELKDRICTAITRHPFFASRVMSIAVNDPKKEPEAPKESRITKVDFEMASALAAAAAPIYGSLMRHPDFGVHFGDAEARAQALEVAQDLLNDAVKFVKNM